MDFLIYYLDFEVVVVWGQEEVELAAVEVDKVLHSAQVEMRWVITLIYTPKILFKNHADGSFTQKFECLGHI
jgi:hypothetical protein